ncbi:50S ribosomal protein L24 [bacterium HR34]|nr:50S ribosomal protein L24 [bacterium HR34]
MQNKLKIKKGDTVLVICGKDRGKTGKILKCFPKLRKVIVEKVNIKKKHMKPRRQGEKGQIIEFPAPINVSNVKFICPKCSKPTRLGYKVSGRTKKRICKKCKSEV